MKKPYTFLMKIFRTQIVLTLRNLATLRNKSIMNFIICYYNIEANGFALELLFL